MDLTQNGLKNYGPTIFTGESITIDYVIQDMGPFYQGTNYMDQSQKILPMPILDKITLRFSFIEDLSTIFNIPAGVKKKCRFYYEEMKFIVERIRLNSNAKLTLLSKKGKWDYAGVTRIMKNENISSDQLMHKARIQEMLMPEGMFVFTLPKKVSSKKIESHLRDCSNHVGHVRRCLSVVGPQQIRVVPQQIWVGLVFS